jgi:alkanesulfonate monooxygenase SsuD/methylene tetrahydromethanopterin reductase-like flavin-dependent oxidoreductase (luciferase family)
MNPQPVQRPHPPILIGGGGEQLTLRVVARHADVWHGFGDLATLKHKIDLIDTYARDYGRDGREIVKSADASIWVGELPDWAANRLAQLFGRPAEQIRNSIIQGDPTAIEHKLRPYVEIGITRFIVSAGTADLVENWRRISEQVIPRFAHE